jgi:cyclopropane fatty-acyl-phospholipid synthase-like methyltransferase
MADRWFEIAALDHFWIQRRFEVTKVLAGNLISGATAIAEIGCGHGLLQRQVEEAYGKQVVGFDLNEFALKQNLSRNGSLCCYDICEQKQEFKGRFNVLFLFDVLEHIADEARFLKAAAFHLAPGGQLIINVPACQWLYSAYDEAAGHQRRYSIRMLKKAAQRANLKVKQWSYWGLPLLPTLMLRKLWLMGKHDEDTIISSGFDPGSQVINRALLFASRCEPLPQKLCGTSLMAVCDLDSAR